MDIITKKFCNDTETCVDESLYGFVKTHPKLQLHSLQRVIINSDPSDNSTVGIISGGGSGHEPFSAGFVGTGMLSASVSGDVFASPPTIHILQAIREVFKRKPKGILVIILNYTGDCLNFGIAAQRAIAENITVETFFCEDDCAHINENKLKNENKSDISEMSITGRRGVVGVLFLFKIAGALAQQGKSLNEIVDTLNQVSQRIGSLGVCLNACSLPGQPKMFNLHSDEMEIGIGVHGEAGIERTKFASVRIIIHKILNKLSLILNLKRGDVVALVINNMGGTSKIEENIIVSEAVIQFEKNNITVARIYSGHLMTSLEMAGIQVSVLCLEEQYRDLWLQCLDAPTDAPAWPGKFYSIPSDIPNIIEVAMPPSVYKGKSIINLTEYGAEMLKECLTQAANKLISKETEINALDRTCGDGDCGSTLRRLAEATIVQLLPEACNDPIFVCYKMEALAESEMGGTSGAIYSLFFGGVAKALESPETNFAKLWANAFESGVNLIIKYSRARLGDRTMLDVLIPAMIALKTQIMEDSNNIELALDATLNAANKGYRSTKNMIARAGRASYVNQKLLKDVDPGAYGVFIWIQAIVIVIKSYINLKQ